MRRMTDQEQRLADGAACLDAALLYLSRGWCPLPLCPWDHVGVGKKHAAECKPNSWGKTPLVSWTRLQTTLPTEAEVHGWWRTWPNANVGMVLGPVSGLVGLDVDGVSGLDAFRALNQIDLPRTLAFTTPGGGLRVLYELTALDVFPNGYENWTDHQELRVLALGTQTVMPPSRHRLGGYYAWH